MSQRTEKEETECKVPENLTSCINNCGVTATTTGVSTNEILIFTSEKSSRPSISRSLAKDPQKPPKTASVKDRSDSYAMARREVNRCSGCRRRVGLTGFRCRCGELFCWEHRYSDRHDCNYDYKTVGREAIARENPVVKAAKISLDMVAVGKLDDGKWHASVNQKETAWALLSILINMRNYKF
ncbi:hypothetical protein DKX38_024830 [Salix brachista]|uniref:AN1-type domain-containing protein n=1 Tax=Salix brachista TaxID=2182728 RepID=A0A5N5JMD2_9ROSI|nr:hypothetical protein DKX38_024830 [Salix brachista]